MAGSSLNHSRGSVVRIKLVNFLTYDELEVRPAPGLNLLLGPNGTGKSSIVCALCLGLSGSPQILGRSTAFKDYIKHGKETASIEIELCATPGQKNPVIKTIIRSKGSNEYYVNLCKKNKDEVREFVKGYHIQLDNLCQFLAQDKVVEFARQSKQDLLLNTEKAAGTVDLFEQHSKLKDSYEEGKELRTQLASIGEKKKLIQNKLVALEKPFKEFEEHEKRRQKLSLLEKKRPWVEYDQLKQEADALKTRYDQAKRNYEKRELELKPLKDEIENAKGQVRNVERQFENKKTQLGQLKTRLVNDLESLKRVADEMDAITSKFQSVRDDYDRTQKKIQSTESTIDQLKTAVDQLDAVSEDDLQPRLNAKNIEIDSMNRKLDEMEWRQREADDNARKEQMKVTELEQRLSSFQNRQNQQLEAVRRFDGNVYNAYKWYCNNKHQFRGPVHLPALDMRIPDQSNIKFIEGCVGRRDLFSFIFESFEDMQHFLQETKRQGIRVAAGEVPRDHVDTRARIPADLERLGFRDFVCNLFEAPEGLKKYLTKLSSLNRIPVGSETVERNLERVMGIVKNRYSLFMTPNKRLTISRSRYGGADTTLNQVLAEPRVLRQTTGNNDASQEQDTRRQLDQKKQEVRSLHSVFKQLDENIREMKRERDVLQQEKNQLRARASERATLIAQINTKNGTLQHLQRSIPDISKEEEKCDKATRDKFDEKMNLANRICDAAEAVEVLCREIANASVERAAFTVKIASDQLQLNAASSQLKEHKDQLNKTEADYNEKKDNVTVMLQNARIAIGLPPAVDQPIPRDIQKAFEKLPDDLEQLDEEAAEQRAMLEDAQGVDRSIANEYMACSDDLNRTVSQETQVQQAVNSWETEVSTQREQWLTELQKLIETISRNFSKYMSVLQCAGEVELENPEDLNEFTAYGVKIKVKFRDNEPLRELNPQHQSGGERSVSTMLYMLALQELSHVPFRCVDEINQGMDPVNERKVFEMMTKLLSGTDSVLNCTQYFMLTPKLLHGLPMGKHTEVWLIHNGPNMLNDREWNVKKFLQRKQALNACETVQG